MDRREIIDAVAQCKASYCRFIDTKCWDQFEALLHATAQVSFFGANGELTAAFNSTPEWVALTRKFLDGAQSIHQIHNAEITVVAADEVSAIWSMEDYIVFPADDMERPKSMHGYGHYHETWRCTGGSWILNQLELRRTILEIVGREH
jgi:hypothetical protein